MPFLLQLLAGSITTARAADLPGNEEADQGAVRWPLEIRNIAKGRRRPSDRVYNTFALGHSGTQRDT
jgi:hypothetical protein